MNAANLALRFLLELAALAGFAIWAWHTASGLWRFVFAAIMVIAAMALWGVFAVPDDPSRSGNAPVPVPGAIRLALELVILFVGAYAWHLSGYTLIAIIFGTLVVLHYLLSTERIIWLLQH